MNIYEALEKAEVGGRVTRHGFVDHEKFSVIKPVLFFVAGPMVEDSEDCDDWYVVHNKVEVIIDGKKGYLSQESAEELKRMLNKE